MQFVKCGLLTLDSLMHWSLIIDIHTNETDYDRKLVSSGECHSIGILAEKDSGKCLQLGSTSFVWPVSLVWVADSLIISALLMIACHSELNVCMNHVGVYQVTD